VRSLAGRDDRGVDVERFTDELVREIVSRMSMEA
jgi:hypothetical protein